MGRWHDTRVSPIFVTATVITEHSSYSICCRSSAVQQREVFRLQSASLESETPGTSLPSPADVDNTAVASNQHTDLAIEPITKCSFVTRQ